MSVVLSFHNTCLAAEDVQLLEDCQWLNDKLIGFMFEYLEHFLLPTIPTTKILFISPEVTQFIKIIDEPAEVAIFLQPLDAQANDLVYFAVNNHNSANTCGGSHWSLLVFDNTTAHFHHFDSSGGLNDDDAKDIAKRSYPHISAKSHTPFKFIRHRDCSQQTNSYDCGMYVVCFAEELCSRLKESLSPSVYDRLILVDDMAQKRTSIKRLIKKLAKE